MNEMNELEINREFDSSEAVIDFKRNAAFFDKEKNKKLSTWLAIAWTVAIIGGILTLFVMLDGFRYRWLMVPAWLILGVGVLMLLTLLPKVVKESEITEVFKTKSRLFRDIIVDKLEYPSDMATMSMDFMGCVVTDENCKDLRKLKSGNYVDSEMKETFIYINNKKRLLYIAVEDYSLIEEKDSYFYTEIPFDHFDKAEIVSSELKNGVKISDFVISKDGEPIFKSPISNLDYYKEEFMNTIEHFRSSR